MAVNNNNSVNVSQPSIPIFKGENYEFWSIKMKTLFKSQELWDLVENGYSEIDEEAKLRENKKRDSKALFYIQQAIDDTIFSKIASASTAKEAWTILRTSFHGSSTVIQVKLQTLHREFQTMGMKKNESVQEYMTKVAAVVNQMRSYGEEVPERMVVSQVLTTLTDKFDHIVAAIEESKDLSTYSFDELMGSLQAHEARINKKETKIEEKAFQARSDSPKENERGAGRGRGRGGRGRSSSNRGRGGGRFGNNSKSNIQCHICKKYGHMKADCWFKDKQGSYAEVSDNIQCHICKKYGHMKADCWFKDKQASYAEVSDDKSRLFMAFEDPVAKKSEIWFVDSGCSNHMTGCKAIFTQFDGNQKKTVKLGDDTEMKVEGKGTVAIEYAPGKTKLLDNVQLASNLAHNLLSVGQIMESGFSILFDNRECIIRHKESNEVVAIIPMTKNRMFPFDIKAIHEYAMVAGEKDESKLWHLRYGHLNINGLQLLERKGMVYGLPKISELSLCEGCVYGKQNRKCFPIGKAWRASECLELIHADLCGPMSTESLGGSNYFLLFTDDFSRMSWVYFLKSKSEAFENFRKFKAMVEKQSEASVKVLRTDRGGEFLSNEFNHFCEENGIRRELTAPYTPEQNGVAERKNRTVVEMARSLLKGKGMPNCYWAEAVATAVYLLNLSPTKAVQNCTPYEAWIGRKPTISHLKVFGSIAYVFVNPQHRQKLDGKSRKCVFIGYCSESKAYKMHDPIDKKIIVSRNVLFNEGASWNWSENISNNSTSRLQVPLFEETTMTSTNALTPVNSASSSAVSTPSGNNSNSASLSSDETPPRRFRSLRQIYENDEFAMMASDPVAYQEAAREEVWIEAMKEELAAIEKNSTWEMTDLPEGKNVIGLKWVFKTKLNADGSIQKHKARLVAKGYSQQQGIDFEETFSPVARFETVRLLLALAAQLKWKVYQLDVKSAFLNGDLDEEVYVAQPEGFEIQGREEKVYKLNKALYGLKQAPRAWYSKIDSYFHDNGFAKSENEPTLYIKKQGTDFMILCLYVDDIIYMGSNLPMLEEFKGFMMNKFEMTDLGLLHYFLGLEIIQDKAGIFVCQKKYATELLRRFNMLNCTIKATPMNLKQKLQQDDGAGKINQKLYRSLVGGLMYLTHTRPDISFAVGVVSRFMCNPSKEHYGVAKRILRYIAGTIGYGIWYTVVPNFKLFGFSDSDWASSLDDRKSTSGNVFNMGSGAITWMSKKQATVALSTAEAEYISATTAASQIVWLRKMLNDVQQKQEEGTELFCDNKSTIAMIKNPVFHGRTKHIDLRFHFIRELAAKGELIMKFCSTEVQLSDILTKALPTQRHVYLRNLLGVTDFESRGNVGEVIQSVLEGIMAETSTN